MAKNISRTGTRNRYAALLFIALLASLTTACVHQQESPVVETHQLHGEPYIETVLVFGLSKPKGVVTEAEWQYFVDSYVTPRYSQGLTIIDSGGQWMMQTGEVIKEDSKILILLYERDSQEENDANIKFIIEMYKKLHQQEAVLRIDTAAGVSF